jgi:hypothetical protein
MKTKLFADIQPAAHGWLAVGNAREVRQALCIADFLILLFFGLFNTISGVVDGACQSGRLSIMRRQI